MTHDSKEVLKGFVAECEELWIDHALYCELFETDGRTLALYEAIAHKTFVDLNRILVGHLFVGFCRVTDPAHTGKHDNLTTNFIVEELQWPGDVLRKLKEVNECMMKFRALVVDARRKRLAHTDLKAQIKDLGDLGAFPKGDDREFLKDLAEFVNIAHEHVFGEPHPIEVGGATDANDLIRALGKSAIFDACSKCSEQERTNAVLNYEGQH